MQSAEHNADSTPWMMSLEQFIVNIEELGNKEAHLTQKKPSDTGQPLERRFIGARVIRKGTCAGWVADARIDCSAARPCMGAMTPRPERAILARLAALWAAIPTLDQAPHWMLMPATVPDVLQVWHLTLFL